MKGKRKSPFERDFGEVANRFPKLTYGWVQTAKMWMITGELDICDTEGVYWDTFMIVIFIPRAYPYCVPIVMEKSNLIPRDIAWHISPEDGILQYYIEELRLPGAAGTLAVLNSVINNSGISRNDTCPCGSGKKVKKCHAFAIESIKTLGHDRLIADIENIQELSG